MITDIIITGQISSVSTLRSKITLTGYPEIKNSINGYILTYPTKGEAIKALSVAYQSLKNELNFERPDWRQSSLMCYKYGSGLDYDAARAYIYNPQV